MHDSFCANVFDYPAPRGANGLAVIVPPPSETSNKKPPAKKRGRPKKAASKPKQSQSGSDSDSSDYESDLEIEPPDEPSPIPPVRPSDTVDAAKYDTMQAVWSPRNKRVPADKVKSALVTFPKIIKTLRDAWKDQVQAMKLAENQGDNDKAMKIKKDVALQRQVMDVIVRTALDVGHPMIVEKYDLPQNSFSPPSLARDLYTPRISKKDELIAHVNSLLWRLINLKSQIKWLHLVDILMVDSMSIRVDRSVISAKNTRSLLMDDKLDALCEFDSGRIQPKLL